MSDRQGAFVAVHEAWAVLRVRQWLIFAPLPAAGVVHLDELHGARLGQVVATIFVSGLALAYSYGLNAIFDRGSDEDPRKNILAGRERVGGPAILSVVATGGLALWGACMLGPIALASIATSMVAGTLYSAGPRWKRFPVLGLMGNLLIFAPLLPSALRPNSIPEGFAVLAATFALLVTQNQLMHEEADIAEDSVARVWTTARWLGARKTRFAVCFLSLAIAASGMLAPQTMGLVVCMVAAVFSAAIAIYVEPAKARRKAHRYLSATLGAALFLVVIRP